MKLKLILVISLYVLHCATLLHGQTTIADVDMDLNLLQAPQSPASSLLGISDSEISKPTDATDFMVNLKQATDNFTSIPVNYAIDVSPTWLLAGKKISGNQFTSNNVKNNIPQSFVLSFAVNNDNSNDISGLPMPNTTIALGGKISIFRGNIKSSTQDALDQAFELADKNNMTRAEIYTAALDSSSKYQAVFQNIINLDTEASDFEQQKQILLLQADLITKDISAEVDQQITDNTQDFIDLSKGFDFSRVGFKLDIQSAVAWDFPDRVYADRQLSKAGAWMTAALEGNNNLSILALGRFLHMPNELVVGGTGMEEVSVDAFDAGARLIYNKAKFSFSGEIVFRDTMGNESLDGSTKWAINTEYAVSANQKLILSYGKAFDGTVTEDGNVLAALNYLMGFGGKRTLGQDGNQN